MLTTIKNTTFASSQQRLNNSKGMVAPSIKSHSQPSHDAVAFGSWDKTARELEQEATRKLDEAITRARVQGEHFDRGAYERDQMYKRIDGLPNGD